METLKRILSAAILVPLFIFCAFNNYLNGLFFFILLSTAAVLGTLELCGFYKQKKIKMNIVLLVVFVILSWSIHYFTHFCKPLALYHAKYNLNIILLVILFLITGIIEIFKSDFTNSLDKISGTLLIFIYMGILFPYVYKIKIIKPDGALILFFIASLAWLCDAFAYFIGKYLGKHKLNLPVSPNKTLEGFIGGAVLGFVSVLLIRAICISQLKHSIFKLQYFIPAAILLIAIAILGDMIESVIKRSVKIKDSMKIIPGHGGILDVFDSFIACAPVLFFLMSLV